MPNNITDDNHIPNKNFVIYQVAFIIAVVLFVAYLLFPMYTRSRTPGRAISCLSNLKELSLALQMYCNDYDGILPSSILHQTGKKDKWDPAVSAEFCSQRGPVPVNMALAPEYVRWHQLLWPHMKNKDIIWCPSDPNKTLEPGRDNVLVSYIYKPALDRAWFGGDGVKPARQMEYDYRTVTDFKFASDQIAFFERQGWHWFSRDTGWRNGVKINAMYLDGHVRTIRLSDAAGCNAPKTAQELANILNQPGEPCWFNYSRTDKRTDRKQWFDPRVYYDGLP